MPRQGVTNPRGTLTLLPCLIVGLAAANLHAAPDRQPDVLFIAVDDLSEWIGPLHGHSNDLGHFTAGNKAGRITIE